MQTSTSTGLKARPDHSMTTSNKGTELSPVGLRLRRSVGRQGREFHTVSLMLISCVSLLCRT